MEEDIKILEENLKNGTIYVNCGNSIDKALENLLTRYKQLEEENKSKQKAYDDCYCEYKHYKQFDSIPKSKVKEKIEELKKKVEELTDEKGYWGGSDLLEQIKVLQELLESEE